MSDWKYFDGSDPPRPLAIGDKVVVWDNPDHTDAQLPGLIVSFDEPDCDYNDELGRAEMYGPYCFVQWPEAKPDDLDKLTGSVRMTWANYPDGPDTFYFDDLIRVAD